MRKLMNQSEDGMVHFWIHADVVDAALRDLGVPKEPSTEYKDPLVVLHPRGSAKHAWIATTTLKVRL